MLKLFWRLLVVLTITVLYIIGINFLFRGFNTAPFYGAAETCGVLLLIGIIFAPILAWKGFNYLVPSRPKTPVEQAQEQLVPEPTESTESTQEKDIAQ